MSDPDRQIIAEALVIAAIVISRLWSHLEHRGSRADVKEIRHNTNALVDKLLKQADREGYDRAKQEQKDQGD